MLTFGLISSLFDLLTLATLLWLTDGSPPHFRTGWFVESLLTELLVVPGVRTRLPCYRSRPGNLLLGLTGTLGIVGLYLLATERAKHRFYRRRAS